MPLPPSERRLRRLIAEMAAFPAVDIQAILQELDATQRDRVKKLLQDYAEPALVLHSEDVFDRQDMSPWLAERASAECDSRMTPHAIEAVRGCAARLFPIPSTGSGTNSVRPSLIGRIGNAFVRRAPS